MRMEEVLVQEGESVGGQDIWGFGGRVCVSSPKLGDEMQEQ